MKTTEYTAETFQVMVGRLPENDDLDRANCKKAGELGHYGCGVCEHNLPVFCCHKCFTARASRLYQPKTGAKCSCRPGMERDNCPSCEGTGMVIDFKAIREGKV